MLMNILYDESVGFKLFLKGGMIQDVAPLVKTTAKQEFHNSIKLIFRESR